MIPCQNQLRQEQYVVICEILRAENGSVANIDNNVLTGVHSRCIGHRITAEKLSFTINKHFTYENKEKSMQNVSFEKKETSF